MTPERYQKLRDVLNRRQPDLTVLADGVHKSHNIAALLRTCDAVGIHRVHAVAAPGRLRRHHMISGGVNRWIDVTVHATVEAAVGELRAAGWRLVAAHAGERAVDFRDVDYTRKVAVVLGAELYGLSALAIEQADLCVAIPMRGMAASLNVSVAGAVILFEAERQRAAAGCYDAPRMDPAEQRHTLFEWAYPRIARRCRALGRPYPVLSRDGALTANPLAAAITDDR